jgi:hypothetical protein
MKRIHQTKSRIIIDKNYIVPTTIGKLLLIKIAHIKMMEIWHYL